MKRIMIIMLTALAIAMPSSAQMTKKDTGNGPLSDRVSKFWKKTKKTLDNAADQVRKEFETENSGLRKINGQYYMNIYDTNIYKGSDVDELCRLCRKEFAAKYPNVDIRSCAIPQTDWETEVVKKDNQEIGGLLIATAEKIETASFSDAVKMMQEFKTPLRIILQLPK